jgi:hypothetical protein
MRVLIYLEFVVGKLETCSYEDSRRSKVNVSPFPRTVGALFFFSLLSAVTKPLSDSRVVICKLPSREIRGADLQGREMM